MRPLPRVTTRPFRRSQAPIQPKPDPEIEKLRSELASLRAQMSALRRETLPWRLLDVVRCLATPWTVALAVLFLGGEELVLAFARWVSHADAASVASALLAWPFLAFILVLSVGMTWVRQQLEGRDWAGVNRRETGAPAGSQVPVTTAPPPPPGGTP